MFNKIIYVIKYELVIICLTSYMSKHTMYHNVVHYVAELGKRLCNTESTWNLHKILVTITLPKKITKLYDNIS